MRTCMPLNQSGMSVALVLIVIGVVGLAAIPIMSRSQQKIKISDQMNVSVSASLVKQKLIGLILAPQSWQATQNYNNAAFTNFNPNLPPNLDIYSPGLSNLYYPSTNEQAGFDLNGNPCLSFRSSGNDNCPLRYQIQLKNRVYQNANWVETLHFELVFKPESTGLILNVTTAQFTFDLVRNLNDQSVEAACISISGRYDATTNSCSEKITRPVQTCGSNQTYRGPAVNSAGSYCDTKTTTVTTCNGSHVVKSFGTDGNPICGAAIGSTP